jgi:hypothetical protein
VRSIPHPENQRHSRRQRNNEITRRSSVAAPHSWNDRWRGVATRGAGVAVKKVISWGSAPLNRKGAVKSQAAIRWNDPRHSSAQESFGAVRLSPPVAGIAQSSMGTHPHGGRGEADIGDGNSPSPQTFYRTRAAIQRRVRVRTRHNCRAREIRFGTDTRASGTALDSQRRGLSRVRYRGAAPAQPTVHLRLRKTAGACRLIEGASTAAPDGRVNGSPG